MNTITFTVFGHAQPTGSKKSVPVRRKDDKGNWYKTGQTIVVDANPKATAWNKLVAQVAGKAMAGRPLLTGPLKLELIFYRPRPKSHYGTGKNAGRLKPDAPLFPDTMPDATKQVRGCEDGMTGTIWKDDAQVCDQRARKLFGEPARAEVIVSEMDARSVVQEPGDLFKTVESR